jgi:hypothetical protein
VGLAGVLAQYYGMRDSADDNETRDASSDTSSIIELPDAGAAHQGHPNTDHHQPNELMTHQRPNLASVPPAMLSGMEYGSGFRNGGGGGGGLGRVVAGGALPNERLHTYHQQDTLLRRAVDQDLGAGAGGGGGGGGNRRGVRPMNKFQWWVGVECGAGLYRVVSYCIVLYCPMVGWGGVWCGV